MTDNKYKKNIGKINRVKELTKTSVLGLLSNLFLFMTKVLMYFFTGSMSILSEALNNLSDCSSSIISIMGVKFAQKPNDKSHPYGHGRIEYLITLVISGMVLVVGGNFVYFSFKKIIHPQALNYPFYTLVLLFLSLLVKIWQSGFYLKKSKLLNSLALKAQSKDSLSDCLITSVVLIGVIIQKFTGLKIDSYIGLLVALFIIYTAIELINQTISILIGKGLSEELRQEIISKVSSYEGISNVHSIIVTDFGPENIIVILDAEIAYNLSLEEAHNIVDKVEREVSKLLNIKLIIHTDPHGSASKLIEQIRKKLHIIIRENLNLYSVYDIVNDGDTFHIELDFNGRIIRDENAKEELKETVVKSLKEEFPDYNFVIRLLAVFWLLWRHWLLE